MDLKNTLAAVSLSAAIIVLWGLFLHQIRKSKRRTIRKERSEQIQNEDAPKLIENEEIKVLSRDNAIIKVIEYDLKTKYSCSIS